MRKFLLYSSALAVFGLSSSVAEAACIQTPTCSSLGYESTTSCSGGLKCPFGNAWNCTFINKITELEKVIDLVIENSPESLEALRRRHNMHSLSGSWAGRNECHVANAGDWLVIWATNNKVAFFERTGSHDELFK